MSEDQLFLLVAYLFLGLSLFFLTLRSENKTKVVLMNLLIAGSYSSVFLYNLSFNSDGGSGLLWLVALLLSIGVHWLVVMGILLWKLFLRSSWK